MSDSLTCRPAALLILDALLTGLPVVLRDEVYRYFPANTPVECEEGCWQASRPGLYVQIGAWSTQAIDTDAPAAQPAWVEAQLTLDEFVSLCSTLPKPALATISTQLLARRLATQTQGYAVITHPDASGRVRRTRVALLAD